MNEARLMEHLQHRIHIKEIALQKATSDLHLMAASLSHEYRLLAFECEEAAGRLELAEAKKVAPEFEI